MLKKLHQKLQNHWHFKQTQVYPPYSTKIIVVQYITILPQFTVYFLGGTNAIE